MYFFMIIRSRKNDTGVCVKLREACFNDVTFRELYDMPIVLLYDAFFFFFRWDMCGKNDKNK